MIFAKWALLPEGWAENVRIIIIDSHITGVIKSAVQQPNDTLVSALLPALSNLHSHAFQRAMAGMTEHRIAGRDSFWTWRTLMYRFLDRLSPDDVQAIAAMVMLEMARYLLHESHILFLLDRGHLREAAHSSTARGED